MDSFKDVLEAAQSYCKAQMAEPTYNLYIDGLEPISFEDSSHITLSVRNDFICKIVTDRYLGLLKEAFKTVLGFDVDIIRAIGRTAGFSVKVENIPFDGLIPALKTRTIDIAINDIGITAERAKSVDFSDRYYIAGMGIVVAKGYQGIQSAKDLEGKRLAVTIGSTGEIAAKRIPHAQVRVFNTLSDCFLELINNGVDAVLNDIPTNDYYAVTAGAGKVDSLSISLAAEDLGIAVKKGRKDLLEKINKGLASLKASGEFTAIYKKWFGREPSPELLR